ncbi:Aste57867_16999 [Aphanomyces stellatus]|uniref:Inositol-pentakisphosphate 2-kinase n=1 Tax=Aphanomyces stellatus TaxID=120398 RepID=A0A485L6R7_9STRA|nr:hypothetical protein As57867_016941 [Aphanomyces stellatus]VFT93760.1 Aste57867_16999 [Aphanomyces stellatus]
MFLSRPRSSTSPASASFPRVASKEDLPPLRAHEWKYASEGGANVVFRYFGAAPVLRGLVLRVRKHGVHGAHPQDIVAFAARHMPRGTQDEYIQVAVAVDVPTPFLEQLNAHLETTPDRPVARRTSHLDVTLTCIMLLPDIMSSSSSSLCIELKPKSSLLPVPRPGIHPVKARVCRFCMHQHLKQDQGKVAHPSGYCPLALFSRDPARMTHALQCLATTPQNNLRVVGDALTDDHIAVLVALFHKHTGILEDLRSMHALDVVDIEGVFALAQAAAALADDSTLSPPLAGLSPAVQGHLRHAMTMASSSFDESEVTVAQFRTLVQETLDAFLVATTFKDCSLLLSLRPIHEKHVAAAHPLAAFEHVVHRNGTQYGVVVAIVDLDIKTHKPLASYYDLDQRIVAHFEATSQAAAQPSKQCWGGATQ